MKIGRIMKQYKLITYLCALSISACLIMASIGAAKPHSKAPSNPVIDFSLTLGEETFDPITKIVVMPTEWEVASQSSKDLRLVQFDGPIQESWIDELREVGIDPIQYIHPYTYITWASAESRNDALSIHHVRWSGDFVNGYRVLPRWRSLSASPIQMQALIYRGVELESVLAQFKDAGAFRIEQSKLDNRFTSITFFTP